MSKDGESTGTHKVIQKVTHPDSFRRWIVVWCALLSFEVFDIVDFDVDVTVNYPFFNFIASNYQLFLALAPLIGAGIAAFRRKSL